VRVVCSADVPDDHDRAAAGLLAGARGVLLPGGGDIDPLLIGTPQASHPTVYGVDRNRDLWERAVFEQAWDRGLPLLAVCRGMQVMNWALGGTLYADIDDCCPPLQVAKGHRQTDGGLPRGALTHDIHIDRSSLLYGILGQERVRVNSIHHQSVRDLAPGLVATAWALDGVIEGMEDPRRRFALAVQFHPEELWRDHPLFARLFSRFAEALSSP